MVIYLIYLLTDSDEYEIKTNQNQMVIYLIT